MKGFEKRKLPRKTSEVFKISAVCAPPVRLFAVLASLLLCAGAQAQNFLWKSGLDSVPQSGFYSIRLSPQWLSVLKIDLADVRIRDGAGRFVPFISQRQPDEGRKGFVEFPLLNEVMDSAFATLEFEVMTDGDINRLELILGNTAVERTASLSGSNDRRQWFIVDENLSLKNTAAFGKERFVQTLSFPSVRYRYLKLKIHNRHTDPLSVERAGVPVDLLEKPVPLVERPAPFTQIDSADGYTYALVEQEAAYPVERIGVAATGPKFYTRALTAFPAKGGEGAVFANATLQSGADGIIETAPRKLKSFWLRIENGENPPLKLTAVRTAFRERSLVAYLEKGKPYSLLGGDSLLSAPVYDLAQFRDSIPPSPPALAHGPLVRYAQVSAAPAEAGGRWLWPSLIAVIALLSLLAFRLLREVGQAEGGR